jgi:predicted PurR-regulated permease PerM
MTHHRNASSPLGILIAAVAIVAALYFAKAIFLPLALAILLSFLLTPLANRLERWGLPRIPAVLVVGGFSFAVIGVLLWVVTIQAIDLGSKLETYRSNIFNKVRAIGGESGPIGRFTATLDDLSKQLAEETKLLPRPTPTAAGEAAPNAGAVPVTVVDAPSPLAQIRDWLGPLVEPISTAGLVVVLVLFMLVQREDQRNRFIEMFGTANLNVTTEALSDAAGRVMRFLRMQFLINAGYGLCVAIALRVLDVPNAAMWGVLGFMLRFLPYVGPILAALMPVAISAAVSTGWTQPLLVAGWFVVLELVLNNLVEPWLYGSSIGVSAVGIIVAAIFWTWLWGPIGLVLAMPLTVCLVVLARYVPQLRFVTILLGDQPALSPAERTYQRLLAMDEAEIARLASQTLKKADLAAYYDNVLIPALWLAERDRHVGRLSEEQENFINETIEDLVDELGRDAAETSSTDSPAQEPAGPRVRVLCIPLCDRADQATTLMLAQLLAAEGFHADVSSTVSLTSEVVDEVAKLESQIAVVSILPPCSPRNSRLLCRRLEQRYPDLPIIVGYWNAVPTEPLHKRFDLGDSNRLVTSLKDAVAAVRTEAARLASAAMRRGADLQGRHENEATTQAAVRSAG